MIPELYDSNCFNLREPVVKNSSSRRRSARILKSKSKKETDVEQIDEQEEGIFHKHLWYLLYSNIETNEDAEVEQEESVEKDKAEEEVEVAKDESKSTESVQVLSTKTAITSHIHTIVSILYTQIAQVHYPNYYFSYSSLW